MTTKKEKYMAKLRNGITTTKRMIIKYSATEVRDAYEAGKAEALSGESCVKLIEQGKKIGRKEAIKRIDNLTEDDWENLIQLDSLDEIKAELKSKIGEVAK